jgi:hypothetical protein
MPFESTEPHLGPSLLSIRLGTRHHPCRIVLVAATSPARGHTGIPSPGASRGTTTTSTATLLAAVVPGSVVPPLPALAPTIVLGWLAVPLTVRICVSASTMSVSPVLPPFFAPVVGLNPHVEVVLGDVKHRLTS